jgi:thiamine transport system substrate-binding protein
VKRVAVLISIALMLAACGSNSGDSAASTANAGNTPVTIRLLTHDSFAVSEGVLKSFTKDTGIAVKVVKAGDAGAMLNQAILTKGKPLGDVLFGVDNTFLSKALGAGIFDTYEPKALADVPAAYRLDATHHVTPIDHGEVCVNYDKKAFADASTNPPPRTLDDLVDPRLKGKLVVESPATSSPGLAFLLATIARYGDGPNGWEAYWRKLKANDVKVADGWEAAYNGDFSGGSGKGDRPLVVSYASSPPAEVYYADPKPADAPTGVSDGTCFRQVEFAGVLRGTRHEAQARKFVDFLLSRPFQEDIPLQMFVFPVVNGATLPEVFTKFAATPAHPFDLSPKTIGASRERWIQRWTELVG